MPRFRAVKSVVSKINLLLRGPLSNGRRLTDSSERTQEREDKNLECGVLTALKLRLKSVAFSRRLLSVRVRGPNEGVGMYVGFWG